MTWDTKASTSGWLPRWRTWPLSQAELRQRWSPHFLFRRLYIVQITSFKQCLHSHNHVCITSESRGQLSLFWVGHQWVCWDRPPSPGLNHTTMSSTIMSRVEDKKMDSNVSPRSLWAQISHSPDRAWTSPFKIFLNIFLQPSGGSGAFMACVHGMLGNLAKFGQQSYNNFQSQTSPYEKLLWKDFNRMNHQENVPTETEISWSGNVDLINTVIVLYYNPS